MRRVTGRSLKEFVGDEIAGPLRADFQIGAEPEDYDRIAEIIAPPPLELPLDLLPEDSPMRKTFSGPPPNADAANTSAWRDAELGALNGHGNARSLATILSAISLGGKARAAVAEARHRRDDLRRAGKRHRPRPLRAAALGYRIRAGEERGAPIPSG